MSLPEPDVHGVWSFGPTLLESHREHLARLAVAVPQEELVTRAVPTAAALHDAEEWLSVRRRSRRGRPLVAVEPHADDMVLSAGGFALTCGRPLHTVTVFSEGSSLHYEYDNVVRADRSTVTQWRHRESTTASELLSATSESLGLAEAPVGSGMS
ncbi:MAG TPA: hypothetical protein VM307_10830, partial [Egibacteraceae bacterium]|nr:hypothetical protein [Egibacteraceae bacterium]